MALVHFTDLTGRHYAIPEEIVRDHELVNDIPADERLTGFELVPEVGGRGADLGYRWAIDGADYVISAPTASAPVTPAGAASEVSVRVDGPSVVLRVGGHDVRVSVIRAGHGVVAATSRGGPA